MYPEPAWLIKGHCNNTTIADFEKAFAKTYSETCQISKIKLSCKNSEMLRAFNYFPQKLHLRCLTGVSLLPSFVHWRASQNC